MDNRTRLEFHGERRIWDGRQIKQKIKGNSALYIYTDEVLQLIHRCVVVWETNGIQCQGVNFLFQGKCLPTAVEPLQNGHLGTEESGRCGEVALWGGGGVMRQNFFREYNTFIVLFYQLLNEAEHHLKNYGDRGAAEVDNTLRDLHDSLDGTKTEFNNCFIIHSKLFLV